MNNDMATCNLDSAFIRDYLGLDSSHKECHKALWDFSVLKNSYWSPIEVLLAIYYRRI